MSSFGTEPTNDTLVASVPRGALRARLSVCLVFVIMGTTMGGWSARIPEVRHSVGLDDAAWGLANTASTAGDLVSLGVVTVLIGRVSVRRLSLVGAALVLANAPLMASATTTVALVVGLATWGFAANLLSTPMNAQAVEVERRYGRPLLSTFHACFSFGVLGGGVLGMAAVSVDVAPGVQLAVSSVLLGALLLVWGRWLPDDAELPRRKGGFRERVRHRFTPRLLLLGAIGFLMSFVEGSTNQWSALYAADFLDAGGTLAAATYTGFAVATATARMVGDRAVSRLGHRRFLRLSSLTAALGAVIVVAWAQPVAALAGFVVLGLGVACVLPSVFGLAGKQPGLTAGEGVSVVVMGQWPGFLLAAPVIGVLADLTNLRIALGTLVLSTLCVALLSGRAAAGADSARAEDND
ncbi:MFS transporter [Streptomyces sp. NPDC003011]